MVVILERNQLRNILIWLLNLIFDAAACNCEMLSIRVCDLDPKKSEIFTKIWQAGQSHLSRSTGENTFTYAPKIQSHGGVPFGYGTISYI